MTPWLITLVILVSMIPSSSWLPSCAFFQHFALSITLRLASLKGIRARVEGLRWGKVIWDEKIYTCTIGAMRGWDRRIVGLIALVSRPYPPSCGIGLGLILTACTAWMLHAWAYAVHAFMMLLDVCKYLYEDGDSDRPLLSRFSTPLPTRGNRVRYN
jgi:hypothetical protein